MTSAFADTFYFLALLDSREDRRLSLTDCLSSVVMQDEGITQALAGDKFNVTRYFVEGVTV
ncbi:MAG: hypothetical protein NT154_10825 [Verrucomicrobia bacterium]|nr:hypothetical protein [Verrucomicrobiota bacterium]